MTTDKKPIAQRTYRVICVSMYVEDLERLDGIVTELRAAGVRYPNRSAVIREALGATNARKIKKQLRGEYE